MTTEELMKQSGFIEHIDEVLAKIKTITCQCADNEEALEDIRTDIIAIAEKWEFAASFEEQIYGMTNNQHTG